MNIALLNRNIRRIHLWFGIGIGLQLGLWLISGLFMTIVPIDTVRGTHLRSQSTHELLDVSSVLVAPQSILNKLDQEASTLTLTIINKIPVYLAQSEQQLLAFNAETGEARGPLSEAEARSIASQRYAGEGAISSATFYFDIAPREYGREGPVWRIDFDRPDRASFYVDALSGDLKAVRTGLWRTFDFMWGLHIMDWSNRENFNSWWIRATAALTLFFFLTGLGLVALRLKSMATRRRDRKRRL
ncbi:MAG: PepSY domain-containing protein [Litorimonas sp.]